ncbi:hypothetical protein BS17DRAFT_765285 [Gyrodon lividus]|nr:hypothetical protein BS17DRAFT_765285 [Gyrodon lividus]
MDGNFSAKHMKMKANMDFNLTQGSGYFAAVPRYKEHLQIANDQQLKSTCHEHKVVNQVHATQKHLAATSIGAIAFARHGCFIPDTVVDFQKVESLSRKYIQVVKVLDIAEDSYKNLIANAKEAVIAKWISQAKDAQLKHIADVTAMDIFDVQLK